MPAWCFEVFRWPLVGLCALAILMLLGVVGCVPAGGGLIPSKASPPGGSIQCKGACP